MQAASPHEAALAPSSPSLEEDVEREGEVRFEVQDCVYGGKEEDARGVRGGRREGYVQKVDESSGREDAAVAEERVGRGEGAERTALELGDDREADLVRRVGPAGE